MCVCVADFIHKITVQASPGLEKRRNSPDLGSGSSPSFGPRFRAIQREYSHFSLGQTRIRAHPVHRCTYCICVLPETLENQRMWDLLAVLHAHKDCVATLFLSKFSLFMCSQPPTRLFCLPLFPCGPPPLPLTLPLPAFTAFSVSHAHPFPFLTVCSSPNII